ncbi:MAG: glucokinase [Nitrospiraceae bacterium]|nr:glucokinase [Nitrospiraceae bacterium]|tara:strand:+ start:9285 stop:10262 length:978 start_codon:yes stop_codon:yes gene_type:complete
MILAGDVGGTKTLLALMNSDENRLTTVKEWSFPSREYDGLEAVVHAAIGSIALELSGVCFGVAGPVVNGYCETTNLPWIIDAHKLAQTINVRSVTLLNDLEAMANSIERLQKNDLFTLNEGNANSIGNRALIAAGTGLGQSLIFYDGNCYHPSASEGGHCDFAPETDEEIRLLQFLRNEFGHVSWERVVSGMGLANLYRFMLADQKATEPEWLTTQLKAEDAGVVITKNALDHTFEPCVAAVRLFVRLYGAEAGNLALKAMATGGLYIGGGIGPKILPYLQDEEFMERFTGKGRYHDILANIPVQLILNPKSALLGAAHHASQLV